MKNSLSNQAGASPLVVIGGLLAIIIIVGSGFLVFNRNTTQPTTSAKPESTTKNVTTVRDDTTSQPTEKLDKSTYLTIKEWGIKIQLPDSLVGNAYYSLSEFDESYGHAEAASISSTKFQPECRESADDLGLKVIRTKEKLNDSAPYVYNPNVLRLGDFWYHNAFGHDGCSKLLTETQVSIFDELKKSIGTISAN